MRYFIFCPYFKTGGPEALHQLCGALRDLGADAWIWYTDERLNNLYENEIIEDYSSYNASVAPYALLEEIDKRDCVWILPEGLPHDFYGTASKATEVVWYLATYSGNPNAIPYDHPSLDGCLLLAQSDYGVNEALASKLDSQHVLKVTDYTRLAFIRREEEIARESRIAQVVYNPAKGAAITNALRHYLPDIRFCPVRGMDLIMLCDLGLKSKLYIDFGHHPGKDRLPREMAALGCGVLTGCDGVASSPLDLPLGDWKISRDPISNDYDIPTIACHIRDALSRYDKIFQDQQEYRNAIRYEYPEFLLQVTTLIEHFN